MKICIDAGHNCSGWDTGAIGYGLREQDVTYKIASKLDKILQSAGIETVITRPNMGTNLGNGVSGSLQARYNLANDRNCDYFISIHCNAASTKSANGTETYVYAKSGAAYNLAKKVNSNIVSALNTADRGVKGETGLAVLKYTKMPAILIETAFISNENDARKLSTRTDDFAQAIAKGVLDFLNISIKQEITTPEQIINKLSSIVAINDKPKAVKELTEAKENSLYWILRKIANK